MVTGSCLCGEVAFQLKDRDSFEVIQCHCSQCRKNTGSTADAMIVVPDNEIIWVSGENQVNTFRSQDKPTRAFCRNCGAAVPKLDNKGNVWVPAGTLDGQFKASVKAHIFVGSKLEWEVIGGSAPQYAEWDS